MLNAGSSAGRVRGKAPARPSGTGSRPMKVVIRPEHLQPGAELVVKDLDKLRANFWWRNLALDGEPGFRVVSQARATRFTPSWEGGYIWDVQSSCGVKNALSLRIIRQFFTLPAGSELPPEAQNL